MYVYYLLSHGQTLLVLTRVHLVLFHKYNIDYGGWCQYIHMSEY